MAAAKHACSCTLITRSAVFPLALAHTSAVTGTGAGWRVTRKAAAPLPWSKSFTARPGRLHANPSLRQEGEQSRAVWDPLGEAVTLTSCLGESSSKDAPPLQGPVEDEVENSVKGRGTSGREDLSKLIFLASALPFFPSLDLEGPGSVLEAIGVLALIVAVHEAGHFLAARSLGIHVTKFAIGFGPTVLKYQADVTETPVKLSSPKALTKPSWLLSLLGGKSTNGEGMKGASSQIPGVEYSLRLFPLGGYVAFPEEEENNSQFSKDDPNLLKNRPLLDRVIVVSAGVIANAVFAFALLFTQVNTVGLFVQEFQPGVSVPLVVPGGAGETAGLRSGDIILEVQGQKLSASEFSVGELVSVIKAKPNEPVDVVVERGNPSHAETLTLRPIPAPDGSGRINVQLSPNLKPVSLHAQNVLEALLFASHEFVRLGALVVDGLRQLVLNFSEAAERLSGPVGIVAVGAEVARTNVGGLFQFAAIVNLNLAIVNILPLPALDGGYLLLMLVEAVRGGKKLPKEVEQVIMSSGLLLLLTAGVILIVRDTLNLAAFL